MFKMNVLFWLLLVVAYVLSTSALDIIQSSGENVWVEEGRSVSLICTSNEPWQWCYWEHTTLKNKTLYQTVQEYTSLETEDPHIKFTKLSNITCGLQIIQAVVERDQVGKLY